MDGFVRGFNHINQISREKAPHLKVGQVTATNDVSSSDITMAGRSSSFNGIGPVLGLSDGVVSNANATFLHGKFPMSLGGAPFTG